MNMKDGLYPIFVPSSIYFVSIYVMLSLNDTLEASLEQFSKDLL
jgi:hypothetical protein